MVNKSQGPVIIKGGEPPLRAEKPQQPTQQPQPQAESQPASTPKKSK